MGGSAGALWLVHREPEVLTGRRHEARAEGAQDLTNVTDFEATQHPDEGVLEGQEASSLDHMSGGDGRGNCLVGSPT